MNQKYSYSRIIIKHDTEENWQKAEHFIPRKGELIVYDRDNNYNYARIKIGDGERKVSDIEFIRDFSNNTSIIGEPNDPITADTINGAKNYAKNYADGLAKNYDPSGSAAQALSDAKTYAEGLALPVVTSADAGSILRVNNEGKWEVTPISIYAGEVV